MDDGTPAAADAVLAAGRDLTAAVHEAVEAWLLGLVAAKAPGSFEDPRLCAAIDEVARRVRSDLASVVATPPADARTTPLSAIRVAVAPLNDALRGAGVPQPRRDEAARHLDPDDTYELGPMSWADLGPAVSEAGIRWGAAVAFAHLRSRRGSAGPASDRS